MRHDRRAIALSAIGTPRLLRIDSITNLYPGEPGANDRLSCWVNATTVALSSDSGGDDSVHKVSLPSSTSATLLQPRAIEPW